jgi:hypothetical protein
MSNQTLQAADARRRARLALLMATVAVVAACGGGGSDSPPPPPPPPPPSGYTGPVTVSGRAVFESVPNDRNGGRLNYAGAANLPIRGATVEVIAGSPSNPGAVLGTSQTDANGNYSIAVTTSQALFVRVKAEYKRSGSGATWDFTVRDNTQGDVLYALDSGSVVPASATQTQNLTAASGWGGSSYTGPRAAGPFAVLDVAYAATSKVLSANGAATFLPLKLFWSVNNVPTGNNRPAGQIGTSFFTRTGNDLRLYLLGAANQDTDEYDTSVVAHEIGHYFQSAFARDDSLGGQHGSGDLLDMRVAFSEGWGNGWAGMVTGDPRYADSFGTAQNQGFILDVSSTARDTTKGWFSETSVQYLFWNWHQNSSIGFTPIYNVMTNSMLSNSGLTSIFAFGSRLKEAVPGQASTITANLAERNINGTDSFGTNESNSGGNVDVLPVYKNLTVGTPASVCINGSVGTYNKLGGQAYLKFTTSGTRTITVSQTSGQTADPDLVLLNAAGGRTLYESGSTPTETISNVSLSSGTHVLVVYDYNFNSNLTSGQRCFSVTLN